MAYEQFLVVGERKRTAADDAALSGSGVVAEFCPLVAGNINDSRAADAEDTACTGFCMVVCEDDGVVADSPELPIGIPAEYAAVQRTVAGEDNIVVVAQLNGAVRISIKYTAFIGSSERGIGRGAVITEF